MLRSLDSGVTAMQQFQQQMDVIGNNIANVNTTGYKSARADFEDALSQTLQGGGTNGAMQVGTGVATTTIRNQFTQGTISRTNAASDLAISGNGFFMVRNATTGLAYATRAGEFKVDSSGFLVNPDGLRVQGDSDSGLTTVGDIAIDATGAPSTADPNATVVSYSVDADGKVTVHLSDDTAFVRGQILLQNFNNPDALVKEGGNLYSNATGAGPLTAAVAPGSNGLGRLVSSSLEMSNVDLTNEFATMITTQRAFQASARIITTSDELLQEVVNLKR